MLVFKDVVALVLIEWQSFNFVNFGLNLQLQALARRSGFFINLCADVSGVN